ncbi:MAG: hypothetical protein ACREJ3_19715, partial [Polyangiaceae bacterium]
HADWLASGPDTPDEITLEQWLRAQRGLVGDSELPVCDGCQCGACATLAGNDAGTPCGRASLELDASGRIVAPADDPQITGARGKRTTNGLTILEVEVHSPAHTPTQTPITAAKGPVYALGSTFESFVPFPDRAPRKYATLPGAWRIGVEPSPPLGVRWPWRASLARADLGGTWNRANLILPAKAGDETVQIPIALPPGTTRLRITLLRDDAEHGTREVVSQSPGSP